MYKVRIRYESPRKFRVRYIPEGAADITIVTTIAGTFYMTVAGVGDMVVDWGDGTTTTIALNMGPTQYSHDYTAGGIITIRDADGLLYLYSVGMSITACNIRGTFTNIVVIVLTNNDLDVFHTYSSWVNMTVLSVGQNNLSSIDTYATWTALQFLILNDNGLSSVETHGEWTALQSLNLSGNAVTSVDTHAAWTDLEYLYLQENLLSSITLRPEWH